MSIEFIVLIPYLLLAAGIAYQGHLHIKYVKASSKIHQLISKNQYDSNKEHIDCLRELSKHTFEALEVLNKKIDSKIAMDVAYLERPAWEKKKMLEMHAYILNVKAWDKLNV